MRMSAQESSIPGARTAREDTRPHPASQPSSATRGARPGTPERLSLVVLGDSANAAVAVERRPAGPRRDVPSASGRDRRLVNAKAGALFSVVTAAGIAEVALLGLPGWVNLLYVVAGVAVALDWLHQQQRRERREASRWLESRTVLELPAPAADPPVPEPDAHELAATEPDAYDPAETERLAEDIGEADAASEASLPRLRALGYTTVPSGDHREQLALDGHEVSAWCEHAGWGAQDGARHGAPGEREASPALGVGARPHRGR